MRSSEVRCLALIAAVLAFCSAAAHAQAPPPQGFAVERFCPSAAGGGWFVMDVLDMRQGLTGAMAMTLGYAHDSLRLPRPATNAGRLPLVAQRALANFGFAAAYGRYRLSLNFDMPLVARGSSGVLDGRSYVPPNLTLGSHPDTLADLRFGLEVRLVGDPGAPFRLGLGAQLFVPNGERSDYVTDGTLRAMGRLLLAGDARRFSYAGQLGVHVRSLDEAQVPGGPRGSELLFGVAVGARLALGTIATAVLGPEVYGQTAFRGLFGAERTGVEALLTARLENALTNAILLRTKLGVGGGLHAEFGAPQLRALLSLELLGRAN